MATPGVVTGRRPALWSVCALIIAAGAGWGQEPLTVVPGRVPYLGEPSGHLVVTTSPGAPGQALTLQATDRAGALVASGPVSVGRRSAVALPLAQLPAGATPLHCRLLTGTTELAATDTTVTRLLAKPHAVQIDNRRRGLIVDGLPFLPFGFVGVPPGRPEGDAAIPPALAAEGFNLYSPYSSGSGAAGLEHIRAWMDRCAEVGVKVNFDLRWECFTGSRAGAWTPAAQDAVRQLVLALRDHPALLSWYIADEPYDKHLDTLVAMRKFVQELDPYHPLTAVFFDPGILQRPEWPQVTDVAWLDFYPINLPGRDQHTNPYWASSPPEARVGVASIVAHWLRRLDRKFAYALPLWYNPQVFGGGRFWSSQQREPSAQELRAMVYAAFVSGATGIHLWPYMPRTYPTSPRLLAEAGRLAQEAIELTPFLLSEEPRRQATASDAALLTAAWQDRGHVLVMAVNPRSDPAPLELKLADCTYSGPAEVLFENRQVSVREGAIRDTIEGQGTRVYEIPEGSAPPDLAAPAAANLRRNASFEEWVNAGSPADVSVKRGPGCTCFLDARTAAHGRHSLRLTAAGAEGLELSGNAVGGYGVFPGPKPQPGGRYRVSVWAQADRPGLALRLALAHSSIAGGETLPVGTQWQEFALVGTAEGAQDAAENMIAPVVEFTGPGTVWLDLLQVVPVQ